MENCLTPSPCSVPHDQQPSLSACSPLLRTHMGGWKSMGSVGVPPFFVRFLVSLAHGARHWQSIVAFCLDVSVIIRSMGKKGRDTGCWSANVGTGLLVMLCVPFPSLPSSSFFLPLFSSYYLDFVKVVWTVFSLVGLFVCEAYCLNL
ncbi:hypothetical protein GGI35DRAFT_459989 [Trichoderma velutinum]